MQMPGKIIQCPNCNTAMQPKFMGDLQDKFMVCPACGTTMDVADSFKRVKTVRTERKRGLFGNREIVEEQIHELRADGKAQAQNTQDFIRSQLGGYAQPQQSQTPPIVVNIPKTGQVAQAGTAGCGCTALIILGIMALVLAPIGYSLYQESGGVLPFGLGHNIETVKGEVIKGDSYGVDFVAYNSESGRIISMSTGGLWLWDAATSGPVTTFSNFSVGDSAAFSPDGNTFIFPVDDYLEVRDAQGGGLIRQIRGRYNHVAYHPNGDMIAAAYSSNGIKLINVADGQTVRSLTGEVYISELVFSPDGTYLAALGSSGLIGLWEVETGKQLYFDTYQNKTSLYGLAFNAESNELVTSDSDNLYFFSISSSGLKLKKNVAIKMGSDLISIRDIAWSPDGKYIALGDFFTKAMVWNVADERVDYRLETSSGISSIDFSSDGSSVVGGSYAGVHVWKFRDSLDPTSLANQNSNSVTIVEAALGLDIEASQSLSGHQYSVNRISYSPDGSKLASQTSQEIYVWDIASGAPLYTLDPYSSSNSLMFSPDGQHLAVPEGGAVRFYNANTGAGDGFINSNNSYWAVYSPDGKLLALNYGESNIRLVNADSGAGIHTLNGNINANHIEFSPDGTYIAAISSSILGVWEVATGQQIYFDSLENVDGGDLYIDGLAFNPNKAQLLLIGYETLYFYSFENGEFKQDEFITIRPKGSIFGAIEAAAWSPDGHYIALANMSDGVFIWNVAKKGIDYYLLSNERSESVAFSPNGNQVAAGAYDDVFIWDLPFGDGGNTNASLPSPTAAPQGSISSCLIAMKSDRVNIRQGPGTSYDTQGFLTSGANVNGQHRASDNYLWYRLTDGRGWVREDVVNAAPLCSGLPMVNP